ncbi:MAG: hypothetical protein IJ629_02740 [Clostridia bacterium]|nr:hypothetical protein [Clostridia bacterium]
MFGRDSFSLEMDKNRYRTRILDAIEPYERGTEASRQYHYLAEKASYLYDEMMLQVISLVQNHGVEFATALKQVFNQELDEIAMTKPSERFEAPYSSSMGNSIKNAQDQDDRRVSADLDERARQNKQAVLQEFTQLLSDDLRRYGIELAWAGRSLEPHHQRGAQEKIDDLAQILNQSRDLFKIELPNNLLKQNSRIFEEFTVIRRQCMKIIEEAVIAIAREQREESEKSQDGVEQTQEAWYEVRQHIPEELSAETLETASKVVSGEKKQETRKLYWLGDMKAFSKPWIRPSQETMELMKAKGISEQDAIGFVWDRFVRTMMINEAFDAQKISAEERDRQLALVERIAELLFDRLIEGKHIEDVRFASEIGAAKESDFGILGMEDKNFWKRNGAEIFDSVGIYPEADTIERLKAKGIKEADIPKYIWDGYCRNSRIAIAFENGKISEEERDSQLALVTRVEEKIFDALVSGKSLEEARDLAEQIVSQEVEQQGLVQESESSEPVKQLPIQEKSGLENTLDNFEQLILKYIAQGKDIKEAMNLAKQEMLRLAQAQEQIVSENSGKAGLEDVATDKGTKLSDVQKAMQEFGKEREEPDQTQSIGEIF